MWRSIVLRLSIPVQLVVFHGFCTPLMHVGGEGDKGRVGEGGKRRKGRGEKMEREGIKERDRERKGG